VSWADEGADGSGEGEQVSRGELVIRARFVRAVQELRQMGFVRPYRRRPDCVEKVIFDVSAW
jgi:hypothetical protein